MIKRCRTKTASIMAMSMRAVVAVFALTVAVRAIDAQQQTTPVHVPGSVLKKYAGEWIYPDGNAVKLTVNGDTLFREVPGQRVRFVALSETLFRLGPGFTAEFVTDKAGGITQVLSDGAAVEFRLRKKGAPPPPPEPTIAPVRVPREVLEQYVGVYEYIPGQMKRTDLRINVRLRGDTLTTDAGGDELTLSPISSTQFHVGKTKIMVEFAVDDAGVTQVLGSGFQQMLARLTSKR
jgi:hypothetical protein